MSELSSLLKSIISHLAITQADRAQLHTDIDNVIPAVAGVALGAESPALAVSGVVIPLLTDFGAAIQSSLVDYVEKRLSGVPAANVNPVAVTPAAITASPDPSLKSTAPTSEQLAATAGQPIPGVAPAVLVTDAVVKSDPTPEPSEVDNETPAGFGLNTTGTGAMSSTIVTDPADPSFTLSKALSKPTDDAANEAKWRSEGFTFNPVTGAPL